MTLNLAEKTTRGMVVCSHTQNDNCLVRPSESDDGMFRNNEQILTTKDPEATRMKSSRSELQTYASMGKAEIKEGSNVSTTRKVCTFDPSSQTSSTTPDVSRDPELPSASFHPKQSSSTTAATTTPYDLQIAGGSSIRYGQQGFSSHQSDAGYRNLEVRVVRPYPLKTQVPKVFAAELVKDQSSQVSLTIEELPLTKRKESQNRFLNQTPTESKAPEKAHRNKSLAIDPLLQKQQCRFPQIIQTRMPPTMGRTNSDESSSNHGADHINRDQRARDTRNTSMASASGADMFGGEDGDQRRGMHPTPLFERLVTEEVQELKAYARIIENQNRRLAELERVHGDLERRLEVESQRRRKLEATLESREKDWSQQFEKLVSERDSCREDVQLERTKNSRLIDQINRKDQDIHRMLQRKYDNDGGRSIRNIRSAPSERFDRPVSTSSTPKSPDYHKSPQDLLNSIGSAEKVGSMNMITRCM